MTAPILVVGVGNPDRGDDGIGPAVVDALVARAGSAAIETQALTGDLTDLIALWRADQAVIVVDAALDERPAGSIAVIDALARPLPSGSRPVSSHGFGLAATVELARRLDRLPRSLTVIAVSIEATELSQPMSERVTAAIDGAVDRVLDVIPNLGTVVDAR